MILQNYEVQGEKIILDKKELESFRDHYLNCANQQKEIGSPLDLFYLGKRDMLIDIIKMFDPLVG